jgi:LPS export ABC transporter protein LptC
MSNRLIIIFFLVIAAVVSVWLMSGTLQNDNEFTASTFQDTDYYMEGFSVLRMGDDGLPSSKLYANYMEHKPITDISMLFEPKLEVYRINQEPLFFTADKGWVTNNNEVILLQGNVKLWEENSNGEIILDVNTSEAKILLVEEYAETDRHTTIVTNKTTIIGSKVRALFKDSRLEVMRHEKTIITEAEPI